MTALANLVVGSAETASSAQREESVGPIGALDPQARAFKPPVYDNAVTTGFYDETSRALFSADCFGAFLPNISQSAADISDTDLRDGQTLWVTIDSPWILARRSTPGSTTSIANCSPNTSHRSADSTPRSCSVVTSHPRPAPCSTPCSTHSRNASADAHLSCRATPAAITTDTAH